MSERWSAVDGYVGEYAVSDQGRVMSMNFAKSKLPGIMSASLRRGYPSVMIGRKQKTVHTLVAAAFIGPRPDGMTINHIDGNKTNNAATNLEYVTASENSKHACRLGLIYSKGERHSQAKLNDEKVIDIRRRIAIGESQKSIALSLEVTPSCISRINTGDLWPHLMQDRKAG